MATYIENQPVLFTNGETPTCICDEQNFEQLVDYGDTTQFQMLLSNCSNETNLITDPNFNDGTDWEMAMYSTWALGVTQLCASDGVIGDVAYNTYQFDDLKYYKVVIEVDSISVGGSVSVYLGITLLGTITTTGTYTFYGYPEAVYGNSFLRFIVDVEGTDMCMSEADAYEILLNQIVGIYDSDGNFITSISYDNDPTYFGVSDDKMRVSIDWNALGITGGCHYLCWMDACTNNQGQNYPVSILNCQFNSGKTFWTFGSDWNDVGSTAVGSSGGAGLAINRTLSQAGCFYILNSISFSVSVDVVSITGTLFVYFGTLLVGTVTTAGIHTFTGIPDTNLLSFILDYNTDVVITAACATPIVTANNVCDYTSNTFKIGPFSNNCTLLIGIGNNSSGFGFEYTNSGFLPVVRIEAKLRQSSYKGERISYKDSSGFRRVAYFDATKFMNLATGQLPEYLHDFLRLMIGADIVEIDGINYYAEDDEYTVVRDNSQDDYGYAQVVVAKNYQNVKNINCQSSESDGGCGGNFLLLEDNENITL